MKNKNLLLLINLLLAYKGDVLILFKMSKKLRFTDMAEDLGPEVWYASGGDLIRRIKMYKEIAEERDAKKIGAFLKFTSFGVGTVVLNPDECRQKVATALQVAGFDVHSLKQLLGSQFTCIDMSTVKGIKELLFSTSDAKWRPFVDAVATAIFSCMKYNRGQTDEKNRLLGQQLAILVNYGKRATTANRILKCGEILQSIVPKRNKAIHVDQYIQNCMEEGDSELIATPMDKMKTAEFAEWIVGQYSNTIRASFADSKSDEMIKDIFKTEGIDGNFYLNYNTEPELVEAFEEILDKRGPADSVTYLASLLAADREYWKLLNCLFQYARLFLQDNSEYRPYQYKLPVFLG